MSKRTWYGLSGIAAAYVVLAILAGLAAWKAVAIAAVALVASGMYAALAADYLAGLSKGSAPAPSKGANVLSWIVRAAGAASVLFLVVLLTAWASG